MVAGLDNIVKDTEALRTTVYDNTNLFDLYDEMLSYDPELSGAVRTIGLTANKRNAGGKTKPSETRLRNWSMSASADDFLVSTMRLMVMAAHRNWWRTSTGICRSGHYHPHHHRRADVIPFALVDENAVWGSPLPVCKVTQLRVFIWSAVRVNRAWISMKNGRWLRGVCASRSPLSSRPSVPSITDE